MLPTATTRTFGMTRETRMTATDAGPLTASELDLIDAWWRAANYLSVGQIYLMDDPLLTEELKPEHVKPRLLGHGAPRRAST